MEHTDHNKTNQCDQCAAYERHVSVFTSPLCKVYHADQRGRIAYDKSRILQTDDRDKQTDSRCDRQLHRIRYGADDRFSQTDCRDHDEEDTGDKHNDKRFIVAVSHPQHDRVCKKSIQSHTGSLCKRNFRIQRTEYRSDKRADTSTDEHTV